MYSDPPSLPDSISAADYPFVQSPSPANKIGGVWKIVLIGDNPDLAGDDTVSLDPKAHSSTPYVSFSLANYYPEHELLLFASRRNEYSRYVLVARATGEVAVAFGPPVFSQTGEWFLTMGNDSISGWLPKGLQLFAVGEGWFSEVIHFRTGDVRFRNDRRSRQQNRGGPARCRWVDDDTFRPEMFQGVLGPEPTNSYAHYRVDIVSVDR